MRRVVGEELAEDGYWDFLLSCGHRYPTFYRAKDTRKLAYRRECVRCLIQARKEQPPTTHEGEKP